MIIKKVLTKTLGVELTVDKEKGHVLPSGAENNGWVTKVTLEPIAAHLDAEWRLWHDAHHALVRADEYDRAPSATAAPLTPSDDDWR